MFNQYIATHVVAVSSCRYDSVSNPCIIAINSEGSNVERKNEWFNHGILYTKALPQTEGFRLGIV